MANAQPTFNVTIKEAGTQKITNLTLSLADTEYNHSLQNGCKKLLIKTRDKSSIKLTLTSGESGTNFLTINAGAVYYKENISLNLSTVYIQSPKAGAIVEIEEWF
ncbi:MAG: hypothetical protein OEL89_00650 [Candidatus Peregrinibacteria bacterium]|nr:hypothetical protein [Candidatus Peregrinibacteria bacterium]